MPHTKMHSVANVAPPLSYQLMEVTTCQFNNKKNKLQNTEILVAVTLNQ